MDTTFLAFLLAVMAALISACLMGVFALWRITPEADARDVPPKPCGLCGFVASMREAACAKELRIDPEEALTLLIRARNTVTAALLAFAALLLICATVIACVYISWNNSSKPTESVKLAPCGTIQSNSNTPCSNCGK